MNEAAFQGHVLSQKNVGAAFWNGDGVEKDLSECVFWYELAANGGDAQAQFATDWFLMTGTGVSQDERKGLKWIHKATFQGYQPAIDYCKEHGILTVTMPKTEPKQKVTKAIEVS